MAEKTARDAIRAALFARQKKSERTPVELPGGVVVEMRAPTEAEFESILSQTTTIGPNGVSKQNMHEGIEILIRKCTMVPGSDERVFESGDDLRSGPYGGWYSTLRKAASDLLGDDEQAMGNSDSAPDASNSTT